MGGECAPEKMVSNQVMLRIMMVRILMVRTELQNVNFFTKISSVQLNLPQEKAHKFQEVFDI